MVRRVSVRKMYQEWAREYDFENNLLFFLEEKETKKIFNFQGKDILDLGCGTGRHAIPLARKNRVVGVDFSAGMLKKAREKAKKLGIEVEFVESDILKFKTTKKFDIILAMFVLDHVKDLGKIAKIISDSSKDNVLVVIANVHPSFIKQSRKNGNKSRIYLDFLTDEFYHSPEEYKKVFGIRGFKLVKSKELFFNKKYSFIEPEMHLGNTKLGIIYIFRKV